MTLAQRRDAIRERCIGAQEKRVFLVEGPDDQSAWRIMLDRFCPGWERQWCLGVAGNKRQLTEILALEQGWLGLVDRDEWDEVTIRQRQDDQPNLRVLPRFCLENYLCDPAELWDGLPAVKQEQVEGGRDRLTDSIGRDLDRFVRHCALWKTVTPLWTGLRALGFKEVLASEDSLEASQNDDKIRQTLDGWHELLDPNRLFDEFQQALQQASSASDHEKFSRLIHGKLFWKAQVHPVLNRLLGQASAPERRNALFQTLPRPADLKAILRELSVTAGT